MSHQYFEEWLLADDPLNPTQEEALQEHLQACEKCSTLLTAWKDVRREVRTMGMVSPPAGFASRWQGRWAAEKARLQRRQAWALLGLYWTAAAALFVLFVLQVLPILPSPTEWVVKWLVEVTGLLRFSRAILGVSSALVRTLPGVIPGSWWTSAMSSLVALVVLWLAAFRRYALQEGVGR